MIKSYGFTANDSVRLDPVDIVKNMIAQPLDEKGKPKKEKLRIKEFEIQQLYEAFDVVTKVAGKDHSLKFFQVPFNLS